MNTSFSNEVIVAAFNTLFNAAERVPFNPNWHNGTGWMNGAVKAVVRKISKARDENDRRLLLIPQARGTLVIFERTTDDKSLIVFNQRSEDRGLDSGVVEDREDVATTLVKAADTMKAVGLLQQAMQPVRKPMRKRALIGGGIIATVTVVAVATWFLTRRVA